MDKVVFLDRDGTINVEKNYLYKPEEFEFIEGAIEGIKLLNDEGYKVVVVSNQAGVARGYYTEAEVDALHDYINSQLAKENAHIDYFFYCPHHPENGVGKYKIDCDCRKPEIGMFIKSEEHFNVDKSQSWMIGDNQGDIEAGNKYGVRTVLVATGYGTQIYAEQCVRYDYYEANIFDAIKRIIEEV